MAAAWRRISAIIGIINCDIIYRQYYTWWQRKRNYNNGNNHYSRYQRLQPAGEGEAEAGGWRQSIEEMKAISEGVVAKSC